jgi:hypothetical protein
MSCAIQHCDTLKDFIELSLNFFFRSVSLLFFFISSLALFAKCRIVVLAIELLMKINYLFFISTSTIQVRTFMVCFIYSCAAAGFCDSNGELDTCQRELVCGKVYGEIKF